MSTDALQSAEKDSSGQANQTSGAVQLCPLLKAVEVLILGEDSAPVADIALQLKEGSRAMLARTGPDGAARFEGLSGTVFQVCPYQLDRDAWRVLRTEMLSADEARAQSAASWEAPVAAVPESAGAAHTIAEGEGLDRVALAAGLFPATVWEHAKNSKLKSQRESGNVLLPGDSLFVPPIRRNEVEVRIATRLVLLRRGVPSRIRIRLFDDLQPLANAPWSLEIPDEATLEGKTDGSGILEAYVPATATTATVTFVAGSEQRQAILSLGSLNPAREGEAWRQRLHNLGFISSSEGGSEPDDDRAALLGFQRAYGLEATGKPDAATLEKLTAVHDGAATQTPPPDPGSKS